MRKENMMLLQIFRLVSFLYNLKMIFQKAASSKLTEN